MEGPDTRQNEQIEQLLAKYAQSGQDLHSYLDGLLLSNYLTYWDYVKLDTLLTLQAPKTDFPDEHIFIVYHQITELYFKLSLHELEQISKNGRIISPTGQALGWNTHISGEFLRERVHRINCYFESLTKSFEIMVNGMEKEQFLRFRMALLPASGFQSAQYRMIEIACTDLRYLVSQEHRTPYNAEETRRVEDQFEHIYWKQGATELSTGKKTLTLIQFEEKYSTQLLAMAKTYALCNVWRKFQELSPEERENQELVRELRKLDINVNINWPLMHYKSAVRYLQNDKSDVPATGGTNWQKYLPPRFQKRVFYPALWSDDELNSWGKGWVEEVLAQHIKTRPSA